MWVQASEKAAESRYCTNSQMQCSTASFQITLTDGGGVDWERPAVYVAFSLLVMLSPRFQLSHFYITAPVSDSGCSVCVLSVLVAQIPLRHGASSGRIWGEHVLWDAEG